MRKPKTISRRVAQDLIDAIYKVEEWAPRERAGFNSCSARCNSLYDITADPRSNQYVARRRLTSYSDKDVV